MEFSNKSREELISAYNHLEKAYKSLSETYSGDKIIQQQTEFLVRERMRELNCHNRMSEIMSHDNASVEEVLQKIVNILPEAWPSPERTEACIHLEGNKYQTKNYPFNSVCREKDLIAFGNKLGTLCVSIRDVEQEEGEIPFLKEGEDFIFSIAGHISDFLERRYIVTSLQMSELKFKNLIENISEVIYEIDNQGTITYISPAVENLLGYSQEDVIGKKFLQFVGTNAEYLAQRFKELFEKGEINHEYEIPAKSGKVHWIRFSTRANIQNGQFVGGNGTLVDITEKKRVEIALLKSEENYRNLVESIKEVIYDVTSEGNIQYISPAIRAVLGYGQEELTGTNIADLVHEADRQVMVQRLSSVAKKDASQHHEYRFIKKSRELCWLRKSTTAIILDDKLIRRIGTLTDINDQKQAELKLQESESLYRSILTASPDVITITDMEGKITFVSPKVKIMFGLEQQEEAIGRTLFDFVAPFDHSQASENITKMMNGHYAGAEEYKGVRTDGTLFDIEVNGEFIRNDENVATGMIFVTRDISDRKLAEEKLLQSEKQYKALFEGNYSVMMLIDPETGEIRDANNAACQYYGWTRHEIRQKLIHEINTFSKEDILVQMKIAMVEKKNHFFFKHYLASGEIRDVEVFAGPMQFGDSLLLYSIVHDVTERIRAEAALLRGNRLYEVISQINQAIVRCREQNELLNEVCRIAIEFGQFRMAWFGFVEEGTKIIKPLIVNGKDEGYLATIRNISLSDGPEGKGPTGNAFREGNYFVSNDIANDPQMILWKDEALSRGYRSSIALPVKQSGKVVASFNLYASQTDFFNQEEIDLLVAATDNLSFALTAIEGEKEREKAEVETKKFRTITDQANYGSAITSLTGEILYQNHVMAEMHGYELGELTGQNLSCFHNPEQLIKVGELLEKLKITGEFSAEEVWHTHKDGAVFPTLMNASIIFDSEHQPQYMSATAIDITDLKKKEHSLWQSQENLNNAQEIAKMGSWGFDLRTQQVTWSKNYYRLLERNQDEPPMTLEEIQQFVHPDDRKLFEEKIAEMLKTKGRGTIYFRLILPEGGLKWIQSNIVPVFDNNRLVSLSGVSIDITEKRVAEEAIREQNSRLNAIISAIPDLMMVLDKNGTSIEYYTNTPEKQIASGDFAIGTNMRDLFDEVTSDLILSKINECIEKQILVSYEFSLSGRNIVQFFEARLAPLGPDRVLTFIRDISDKKKQEIEINKLTRAVVQSPVSIVITNLKGEIEFANPKACETTGYSNEELHGNNPRVLKSGETRNDEYEELWNTIVSGKQWHGTFHNKRKNGELYWESSTISPVTDSDGKISHFLAIKEDITQRKKTEEALLLSEERFLQVTEQSHTVIWELDPSGLFTYVSSVAESVWGYTPDELIGKLHFYDLHPEKGRDQFKKMALRSFSRRERFRNFIYQVLTKNGKIIWVSSNGVPILSDKNELVGYRGAENNITERILAEETIKQRETALNKAQEISQMNSWELNVKTDKLSWSNNYYQMMGVPVGTEVTNATFMERVHPEDLSIIAFKHEELLRTRKPVTYDLRMKLKEAEYRWIQNNIVPEFEGEILAFLKGVNIDITEKKNAEEKIRQQNERLSAIIGAMPDLILIVDRDGTCLESYSSDPYVPIVPGDQRIGMNIKAIFSLEIAQLYLAKVEECLATQQLITYEFSEGTGNLIRSFEIRLAAMGLGKVLTFVRDISDKRLKDSEIKRLSLAVEQSPVSIVITDLNANIEYVNPAFEETTGYTFEEVRGQNASILKSGETSNVLYREMWETIENGGEWHGEWINRKKNGELFWENISISPIHDENGNILNYLAVKQDISLRKQAEQEISELNENLELKIRQRTEQLAETNRDLLKEIEERKRLDEALIASEQSYQTVVENVNEVIFQTDAEGSWIFLNKSWEKVTGYTVSESLGKPFLGFVHPDDWEHNNALFLPLINREKEYCKHVVRYLTKDGGFRWIEVFARLGLNSKDEVTGTYGTLQDITERKRAEDFENEMLQLSPKLTGVTLKEIHVAIEMALSRIGKFLTADRAYIFEINVEKATMSNTFEWCNIGVAPELHHLKDIPFAMLPSWMDSLNKHENIIIPSVSDLPESWSAERAILEPQGIKSLVVIPMLVENVLVGFVGLDSVKNSRSYNLAEINILKVWSSMLSSLVNNQRTERLLEQTRQNYETFFNTIDDFLWVLDEQGRIIHTNNTVKKRLEYLDEELFNESVLLVHPAERREEAGRIVGEMLAGISEFCPVPVVTKTGKQIPVETRVKAGFWNGVPVIFGVSKDISQIQLSEQKFSSAFQSNSAMMAISYFEGGQYLDVNNSFTETMGFSREEVIGKTNEELGLFVDSNLRTNILEQLKDNTPVRKLEILMKSKDGTIKTGLLSADSIFIGQNRCLLTVNMDISERKQAENDLKRARMEADQANLAKSEFLSRMSHELRTPMNSILGFAQLLEMGELNAGQKKGVSHIMRSGKHLLDLINEVLDISRIEAGHLSLSLEPLRVHDVIHEVLDILRLQAMERKIRLELQDVEENHLYIRSDKQRMKQILLNLVGNAIKYNKKEGSVVISTQLMPENTTEVRMVRISVKDTGYGISAADLPKLFHPFERIGAEKTETEGTGLGLSVVKKLVEAMHGMVGVESNPGEGSIFWIEFSWSNGLIETNETGSIINGLEKSLGNKNGSILYIEDNLSNVELVAEILASQRSEIRLITESKGNMAVPLAAEFRPDLILLDLNLPDIHGSEVLKLLQTTESTKLIPVVVISADAMPRQIEKLILSGAKNYLTKPLDLNGLLKIIDEFVD